MGKKEWEEEKASLAGTAKGKGSSYTQPGLPLNTSSFFGHILDFF